MSAHWLAEQVSELKKLSLRCYLHSERWAKREGVSQSGEAEARAVFRAALRKVVEQIGQHQGVSGCFVAHDGLVVESTGQPADYEALAAMSQWCVTPGHQVVETLSLGALQQILLIGSERKLVMIQIGQMTLGILAPTSVYLSDVLKT
jgi:predicted regulator of Ras-like GTPase activity (Roadblock/LC7/MglB family)